MDGVIRGTCTVDVCDGRFGVASSPLSVTIMAAMKPPPTRSPKTTGLTRPHTDGFVICPRRAWADRR